jgi:hypothetical protein
VIRIDCIKRKEKGERKKEKGEKDHGVELKEKDLADDM